MAGRRSLDTYRRKREPGRTPEPFAAAPAATGGGAQRFVVQQHAARRMHWDFRLEIAGVLASWAVPKGPTTDPKEKRLAVQVEDHPLEYADFEGVIPAGNYGAGAVIVWDTGTYRTVEGRPPADGLRAGKLDLELFGHKLRGRWVLVRTKGAGGAQWLLFKKAEHALPSADMVTARPASVLSGLTVDEVRAGARRDAELAALAAAAGAAQRPLPATALAPMLAGTAARPFTRRGWTFELKYDGVRALVIRQGGGSARLRLRSGRDATVTFPELASAAGHLPADDFVLDGEIIGFDGGGAGAFERLQQRLGLTNPWDVTRAAAAVPVQLLGFDCLAVAGYDLRPLPLATRKAILRRLLPALGVLQYADHIEELGEEFFNAASDHDVEGIVAKRSDSPYASGRRSRDWLKIKRLRTADLAVVGYRPGKGTRADLGALLLAWRRGGTLIYAGDVGSGLAPALIHVLLPQLRTARRATPAFALPATPLAKGAVFVEPGLVAEVRFAEVTGKGLLRQPVLLRLRPDKTIAECDPAPYGNGERHGEVVLRSVRPGEPTFFRDASQSFRSSVEGGVRARKSAHLAAGALLANSRPRFTPTNLEKLFWPADGYTKGDLLAYYDAVWPAIEPYLRDRPVVLTRYPDGIEGKSFFQKDAPEFVPDWVRRCRIDDTEYFVCDEREALRYVINLGCIPLHVWSARASRIEYPDWAILDLDPKGAPWRDVIAVARCLHAILTPLGAPHFVKTSGQDGLHVLLPLDGSLTHEEAKTFAEVLARVVSAERPAIATVARPLGARGGKVYVDFLQNGRGKTIAGPFSVRPRAGAPVSMPLAWSEVTKRLDPTRFTIRTVPQRIVRRADPMGPVFNTAVDVVAVLTALRERLVDEDLVRL